MRCKNNGSNVGEILGSVFSIKEKVSQYSLRLGTDSKFGLVDKKSDLRNSFRRHQWQRIAPLRARQQRCRTSCDAV